MNDFPDFMKSPANRIATTDHSTPGVKGYVVDGLDGSQMAFWTCSQTASSSAHVHDVDEYMLVVPSGVTSKPTIEGHFKTDQGAPPWTRICFTAPAMVAATLVLI